VSLSSSHLPPKNMPESSSRANVLIVDPSEDAREALRTGLRRCGLETIEAAGAEQGLAMFAKHEPEIVVLDVDPAIDPAAENRIFDRYSHESEERHAQLVVLGRTDRNRTETSADHGEFAGSQFFSKPYHFGAVIRKIEELVRLASH